MMGCPKNTLRLVGTLVLVYAGFWPAGAAAEGIRSAAVIWAEDAFSGRIAELIIQSGHARLAREQGIEAVPAEALVAVGPEAGEQAIYREASDLGRQGAAAYENLEPVQAVEHLRQAVERFERVPGLLAAERKRPYLDALTYLGAASILKGDPQEGQAAFRQLLVLERRSRLDKRLFPPGMVRMFESAREEITNGPVGSLAVFSSPTHGRVYVDGLFRGVTPLTVDRLPPGRHLVLVRKAGFAFWGKVVAVEAVDEKKVHCRLFDLPGGEELARAVAEAAAALGDPLEARMQALALSVGLERLAIGRLAQRDTAVGLTLGWYDVRSGKLLRSHAVVIEPESQGFAKAVDSVFSYLITGRQDVLQSAASGADGTAPLQFKDEALFVETEVPVHERWYFWTAIGVGVAAAVAITLGVLLTGQEQPGSQILLEF